MITRIMDVDQKSVIATLKGQLILSVGDELVVNGVDYVVVGKPIADIAKGRNSRLFDDVTIVIACLTKSLTAALEEI